MYMTDNIHLALLCGVRIWYFVDFGSVTHFLQMYNFVSMHS